MRAREQERDREKGIRKREKSIESSFIQWLLNGDLDGSEDTGHVEDFVLVCLGRYDELRHEGHLAV